VTADAPDSGDDGDAVGGTEDVVPPTVSPSADDPPPTRRGRSRRWAIGIAAAVVVVAGIVAAVVVYQHSRDPFSSGSGTATITWTSVKGSLGSDSLTPKDIAQPFAGNISGVPISGVATSELSALYHAFENQAEHPKSSSSSKIRLYELKGTFDGKAFNVGLYVQYHLNLADPEPTEFPAIQAIGTYGKEKILAKLDPPASALKVEEKTGNLPASAPVLLTGTIGTLRVSGRIDMSATRRGTTNVGRATFVLAG
jgi:hypothetical protein